MILSEVLWLGVVIDIGLFIDRFHFYSRVKIYKTKNRAPFMITIEAIRLEEISEYILNNLVKQKRKN